MCSATLKQEPKTCRFGCQNDDAFKRFIGWLNVWVFGDLKSIISEHLQINKIKKDYENKS